MPKGCQSCSRQGLAGSTSAIREEANQCLMYCPLSEQHLICCSLSRTASLLRGEERAALLQAPPQSQTSAQATTPAQLTQPSENESSVITSLDITFYKPPQPPDAWRAAIILDHPLGMERGCPSITIHESPLLMGSSLGCLDLSHQWPKLGGSEPHCWHCEGDKSGTGERELPMLNTVGGSISHIPHPAGLG